MAELEEPLRMRVSQIADGNALQVERITKSPQEALNIDVDTWNQNCLKTFPADCILPGDLVIDCICGRLAYSELRRRDLTQDSLDQFMRKACHSGETLSLLIQRS